MPRAQMAEGVIAKARSWAGLIKRDVLALWFAARDPRTPWQAKVVAGLVAAYALSPIDLIPDFIPVLGYLDDLLIVPLGIVLAVKLIPTALMAAFRARAAEVTERPASRAAAICIIAIWLVLLSLAAVAVWSRNAGDPPWVAKAGRAFYPLSTMRTSTSDEDREGLFM